MSITNEQIVEALAEKKLGEIIELIASIEERFGVTAAAVSQSAVAPESAPEVEEKTEFDITLKGLTADDKKMSVIRALRAALGSDLSLKEAKEMVEKAPVVLKTGVSKEVAEEIKTKLSEAGATIEVK